MAIFRKAVSLACCVLAVCLMISELHSRELRPASASVISAPSAIPWNRQAVIALAEKVGDYQLATMAAGLKPNPSATHPDPRGWEQGALFMAPPVWLEMSNVTGDPRYANYAKREFRAITDKLYDLA